MTLVEYVIPFRDRHTDPLRSQNLSVVLDWWDRRGITPMVVSDGRDRKQLFNRCAAYNRGIKLADADTDVYVFTESDMLIDIRQIDEAVKLAQESIGMVVPFTSYHYHNAQISARMRSNLDAGPFAPMWKMDDCTSIGAINVVSRATMDAVGQWDEKFEGNWYDDDAMKLAFETICAPTRFVEGIAHHLYHLPGHRGKHLTEREKGATAANQRRLALYERAAEDRNTAHMRRLLRGEM